MRIIFYNSFRKEQFELQAGFRPWHILMLLAEGRFECKIGEKSFLAEAGDIVCFPAGVPFERRAIELIRFHQVGFSTAEEDPCGAILPAGKLNLPKEDFKKLILALDRELGCAPEAGRQIYTHLASYLLMNHFIDCKRERPLIRKAAGDIGVAVQYLADHRSEKINMEELARKVHLSYTGFLWKFQKVMKCTPSEYLLRIRMQYAKQLLLDSDLRIGEIAPLCGYSNAYYFSAAFHRANGMSPTAYRAHKFESQKS